MIKWRQDARTVASWIDSLPVEGPERDAIIQHPDPTYDGRWWWIDSRDCGCLVGCVVDAVVPGLRHRWRGPSAVTGWSLSEQQAARDAGGAFPGLTGRFPPRRVWAWAKNRAARPYRTHARTQEPAPLREEVVSVP